MATVALPAAPTRLVARAVIVWRPGLRVATVHSAPVPRRPSRSEVQVRVAPRSPSTGSVAVPTNVTAVESRYRAAGSGRRITTVGTRITVRVAVAVPTSPPASVDVAVMVCTPSWSAVVAKLAPVPIGPSRSEDHARAADRLPSVASSAVPANETLVPSTAVVPAAGAAMVTTGGVGVIATVIDAVVR